MTESDKTPIRLPSLRQLLQLLPWSQGAPHALLQPPAADWRGMTKQATRILPYLWATAADNPLRKYGRGRIGTALSSPPHYMDRELERYFCEWTGKAGPNAASSAIILTDVAESLDLIAESPLTAARNTSERIAVGELCLQELAAELITATRQEVEPGSSTPELPDTETLLRLLHHIHPQRSFPDAPPWRRIVHETRRIAIFDRSVPRETWQRAVEALGPCGATASAILACVRQSLECIPDPAASICDFIASSSGDEQSLASQASELLQHLDDMPCQPAPGELTVVVPTIDLLRLAYAEIANQTLLVPDIEACTWFNLHDRIRRIHLPCTYPDPETVTQLLGQQARTVIAIVATDAANPSMSSCTPPNSLWFEAGIRVAQTGPLDLQDALDKQPYRNLDGLDGTKPLYPIPSFEALRRLIPDTQWAPQSTDSAADYGWPSVLLNTRKLAENLEIGDAQWKRLNDILGPRHAAAAVLYAAPRPHLAPVPELLHRILDTRSSEAAKPIIDAYRETFNSIEIRLDIIIRDAVEQSPIKPANRHHLPNADELLSCNLPQVRDYLIAQSGDEPDWTVLADLARDIATAHLDLSDDEWRRACRKIGTPKAAAAAFAAVAATIRENRIYGRFDSFVRREASNPGLLAALFRDGQHSSVHPDPSRFLSPDPSSKEPQL